MLIKIVEEVSWAPANSKQKTPDFFISAMKGTVVASMTRPLTPLSPLMTSYYFWLISGDFIRNQLISAVFR